MIDKVIYIDICIKSFAIIIERTQREKEELKIQASRLHKEMVKSKNALKNSQKITNKCKMQYNEIIDQIVLVTTMINRYNKVLELITKLKKHELLNGIETYCIL